MSPSTYTEYPLFFPPEALTRQTPLMSIAASGTLLNTWIAKYRFYRYRYPRPHKKAFTIFAPYYTLPYRQTVCDLWLRAAFANAVSLWQNFSQEAREPFNKAVARSGACLSGYNLFISITLKNALSHPLCPCSKKPLPDRRHLRRHQGY